MANKKFPAFEDTLHKILNSFTDEEKRGRQFNAWNKVKYKCNLYQFASKTMSGPNIYLK